MTKRPRKSSACVTLVLIGAAALTGCGGDTSSSRRASYASKEACLADWGDPKECEEQSPRSGQRTWGPAVGTWHSYSSGRSRSGSSSSYGSSGSSSSGSHSTSRGGFGSHRSSAS